MTSSGLNWSTLGFQMYQCQTIPWNFWETYQGYLRNVQPLSGAQWYVEFSGSPLLLPDNPFDYTGKLTRQISGNYTCRVYAKKTTVNTPIEPEDVILVASAEGTTPNGCMELIDEGLTPRIEAVKQQVWDTIAKNEERRWLAKQQEAQAAATAAAATNAAIAAKLQAEADRLAAVNARDLQTKLAMQAAAAKTGAAATVKSFLNLYYALPADWSYEVEQTQSMTNFRLEAFAKYFGGNDTRGPVPAGYVELNPQLYGNDPVAIWSKLAADFPSASTSKPVFMNTVQACRYADGLAAHLDNFDDLGPPPVMLETATPDVHVGNPNQVFSSSGVPPWDSQPDVIDPLPVPDVTGVRYGEGWTGTIKTTSGGSTVPDGFLDWLNLKVPNPEQVKMIRLDPSLLEPYLAIYSEEQQKAARVSLDDGGSVGPALPKPQLYDEPLKPDWLDPQDGTGVLPTKQGQGSTAVQKPGVNIATLAATGAAGAAGYQDNVGLMLAGGLTDFYNMLAQTYQATLAAVAAIPQARADLNELIDIDKPSKVEQYLRDFDEARYNAPPPPPPPPKEEAEAPKDNKMLWIGLGLLAAVFFVYNRKAEANAN